MWCVLVTASLTIFFLGVAPSSQEENVVVEDMYRGSVPPFSPRTGRDVRDGVAPSSQKENIVDENVMDQFPTGAPGGRIGRDVRDGVAPSSQKENIVDENVMDQFSTGAPAGRFGRDVSDELNERLVDDNNDSDMEGICRPPKCII
ncbi:uncharacterized protein LOC124354676 [Homalodisca vitripennis]|uniref:uncharacterized protein LOC124354676 n=1 Tax=Homalodisca vitripennis TaxID=197043 RepID=UPI001EEA082E|nr:uncharacterized protein LOC124354676 [Homalodisca vitripennis]